MKETARIRTASKMMTAIFVFELTGLPESPSLMAVQFASVVAGMVVLMYYMPSGIISTGVP